MYSPTLYKYRDSYVLYIPTVHTFSSLLHSFGTNTHTWRFCPLMINYRSHTGANSWICPGWGLSNRRWGLWKPPENFTGPWGGLCPKAPHPEYASEPTPIKLLIFNQNPIFLEILIMHFYLVFLQANPFNIYWT